MLEKGTIIRFKPSAEFSASLHGVIAEIISTSPAMDYNYIFIESKVIDNRGTWTGSHAIGNIRITNIEVMTSNKDYAKYLKR